jgi:hypothetical protein
MVFICHGLVFVCVRMVFISLVMILNFITDGFHLATDDFQMGHVFGHIRLFFAKKGLDSAAFAHERKRRYIRPENLWRVCRAATADGRRLEYVCFEKKRKYNTLCARACVYTRKRLSA